MLSRAESRVAAGESKPCLWLRELGVEEEVDYAVFFQEIVVRDIANRNKRNDVLLKYLLSSAQSQLRFRFDLKGGGVTMKIDESARDLSSYEQAEQLEDAIEIMADRLDGSGVAEPVIRPRGKDAIEIQMPGASTKQNPEIIDVIKKPARLEFRAVHETLDPYTTALKDYPVGYEVGREATGEIVEDAFAAQSITGSLKSIWS